MYKRQTLLWSPKAGCTSTIQWFFFHANVLEQALIHHSFVHRYRQEIFQTDDVQKSSLAHFIKSPAKYTVIKTVRNPLSRAVSSYIHAIKRKIIHKEMSIFLNRILDDNIGFSFREFLLYLKTLDIHSCDPHLKSQVHYVERELGITVDYLFPLEMTQQWLSLIETTLNLPKQYDMGLINKSPHHSKRESNDQFVGDKPYIYQEDAKYPKYESFYDDEIKELVLEIYSEDVERYRHLYPELKNTV